MGSPALHHGERFTYRDYLTWPDEERWELIEGAPCDMSPAPSPQHQAMLAELIAQFVVFLRGKPCRMFPAPFDVRLPERDEADDEIKTVVQPDLAVICDTTRIDRRGCRGAPDFVLEILSPGTAAKDQGRKVALYERHGVREYWILHPADGVLMTRTLGADGRFGVMNVIDAKGHTPVATLPGLEVDLDAVRAAGAEFESDASRK